MNLPFSFPPWVPWWVPVAILLPALLYVLIFLAMPFVVLGVRNRLDVLEARLDEIQGEIRALVLRLPEPDREPDTDFAGRPRREAVARPPIPPAPAAVRQAADRLDREPTFRTEQDEPARRFAAPERVVRPEGRSRFAGDDDGRRRAPPPPPPPRRAEPRIDWPRSQS